MVLYDMVCWSMVWIQCGMVICEVWYGVVQHGYWWGMVCNTMVIGEVWLGERWNAPLPSSSQLIRLHGPAELPEYIYPRITEPSLHASLALASPTFSYLSHLCNASLLLWEDPLHLLGRRLSAWSVEVSGNAALLWMPTSAGGGYEIYDRHLFPFICPMPP